MKPRFMIPGRVAVWVAAAMILSTALPVWSAKPVYLIGLKIQGSDVEGESMVTTLGREGAIECLSFSEEVYAPRDPATGQLTGRRQYLPITFTKRVDKSSPLLIKALTQNETFEGEFRFYRIGANRQEEHYFTVKVTGGFFGSIRRISPDTLDPVTADRPVIEEVTIVFGTITWIYEPTGAEHADDWRGDQ